MRSPSQPVWISHRGYKKTHVENTLEAFQEAVDRGFSVLETDLRVSRDGHLVLCHDPTLERLCGDRRRVEDLSRKQLEDILLQGGARFLFLDEFIQAFPACQWIFDIKAEQGNEAIRTLGAWAFECGKFEAILKQARFLAWRTDQERLLQRLFPGALLYPGERDCWRAGAAVLLGIPSLGGIKTGKTYSLPPHLGTRSLYTEPIVNCYRERGAKLLAFLPEKEEDLRRAIHLNFDEILTDGDILST